MTVIFEGNKPKIPPNFKHKDQQEKSTSKTATTNAKKQSEKQKKTPEGALKDNPFLRGDVTRSTNPEHYVQIDIVGRFPSL